MWNHCLKYWCYAGVIWTLAILVVSTLTAVSGDAAQPAPTTITSERMMVQGKARKAIFEKSVVFTREGMVMRSDRMIVFFKKNKLQKNGKSSGNSFEEELDIIEAEGSVVIERTDGNATSGRAVYYKDEHKLLLTESPVAWQNGTRVTGKRMTLYLRENRSIVEGGAHVVIPEQEEVTE